MKHVLADLNLLSSLFFTVLKKYLKLDGGGLLQTQPSPSSGFFFLPSFLEGLNS